MKRIKIDELTRLAFIWAEQDRDSYAQCWEKNTPEHREAKEQCRQLRAYRLKRWGRTNLSDAKSVDILR